MIGKVIDGKYKIEKRLGEGGFAEVYAGTDLNLKRTVAVKILKAFDTASEKPRSSFQRESESMANLRHPNIVTVYDGGSIDGMPYLVMEQVVGPSLLELVRERALSFNEVCRIGEQICAAMAHAHSQGIIHRDLTLRNIMLSGDSEDSQMVKILDFGLAKVIFDETKSTSRGIKGTPYYMAPEQIRNEKVDGRVDIFAFGVCLYRMANGRFPFEAEHPASLMYLILNEKEAECEPAVPAELRPIIHQCLEKDPRRRADGFDTLAASIAAIRAGLGEGGNTGTVLRADIEHVGHRGSKRNPYLNRVMIKHPADFVGREREVRRIYSRLDAPHPQSISVVGDRRIGKSSLLNYVYQPANRQRHMQNHGSAIFVYLDFQREAEWDIPRFIDFLLSMFHYEGDTDSGLTPRGSTLEDLKRVVEDLNQRGKRIIVLMDEFEVITRNAKFDESFFSFLRSLANSYAVAYVTSSYEDLQKLCHNKDISDSPFFNIFSNLPLRPFTREEATELIVTKSAAEGVPLEPYADTILDLAGLFPIYLQMACSAVFEHLEDQPDREPDWNVIGETFFEEVEQHYRFVWEHFDAPAQENLSKIAAAQSTNRKYDFVNEALERRGYLMEANGGFAVYSTSFRDFIRRQGKTGKRSFLGSLLGRKR